MKQWFERFSPREQLSLLVMTLAVGLYLLYMLALHPLASRRDALAAQNQGVAASLQRVDSMVSEIKALGTSGAGAARSGSRNLTTLVNRSTRSHNLQVSRLQPNSRGEIQVRLEAVVFDDLIAWLHDMEYRESLLLQEVAIAETGASGRVNATVRIASGS